MPMPLSVKRQEVGFKRYIDVQEHAMWLVSYFEGYVLEKANQELVAKGGKPRDFVTDYRKEKWLDNAFPLVSQHPLQEVADVVDWLFHGHFGFLPVDVAEHSESPEDRKVTRIRQIEENYGLLVEAMHSGVDPDPVDGVIAERGPTRNYGEPFADLDQEAKVTELVELFTEFRLAAGPTKEFHHTRTWSWAKTFRIMLARWG